MELIVLAPAENLPPEQGDNRFLWQAEAKPLPEVGEPSDANAQEIAVTLDGAGEVRLLFNAYEASLADRVAGVCNTFYVTSGRAGVDSFLKAIVETGWRAAGTRYSVRLPDGLLPKVRGEPTYGNVTYSPKRHALRIAVEKWQEAIPSFEDKVVERTQAVALDIANKKLEECAARTLRESLRYLKSGSPRGAGSGKLVQENSPLAGADVAELAQALTQIAAMRRELELFASESDRAKAQIRRVGIIDDPSRVLGPSLLHAGAAQDLRGLLYVPSAAGALAKATQGYDAAARLLAQECSKLCRAHPVLHRLWDQPIAYEVADLWNNTPAKDRVAALQAQGTLSLALTEVLNAATTAAFELITELRVSPDEIWRYDPAIYAALDALHLNEGDIAWRAAEDHLVTVKGSMSTISRVSLALSGVELIAAASAVAPPVAAALAVLSTATMAMELGESAFNESRKDRAFRACLDPADSLAVEAGSYAGLVIGALFMLLQIRSTGKSLTKLARP